MATMAREDIRKLIADHEAEIAPESLGYLVRGLIALTHELLQDSPASDPHERMRDREMLNAAAFSAQFFATLLARWLGEHIDHCETDSCAVTR